ncbi:hypothetical protein GCM10009579_01500 [Streptomyces javensis]|uniref:Alcohol dehydrogenase-like C-terminal domain-containing protein n=1 Tax=Streptomyces javensis TaxID=114698 RepID=A0ABP4H220_9ACTN
MAPSTETARPGQPARKSLSTTGRCPGVWWPPHLTARPGARVLVVARGSIGLYVCDIARALGASEVFYVDPDPTHRELARGYGAATAETPEPVRHGFDIAVEATGRVDQLALAVKSFAPEGICESAGNHFRPGELPLLDMYLTGVTLRVARDNVRGHIPDAPQARFRPRRRPRAGQPWPGPSPGRATRGVLHGVTIPGRRKPNVAGSRGAPAADLAKD